MDEKFFLEIPDGVNEYLNSLKKNKDFQYSPSKGELTTVGEELSLGFSCFAIKIYFMTGKWNELSDNTKSSWIDYINSFQVGTSQFPNNSYIDPIYLNSFQKIGFKQNLKFLTKSALNFLPNFKYDGKKTTVLKGINAETKQAVSTLFQVGNSNKLRLQNTYNNQNDVELYLDTLNWKNPWSAGAQFASLCVYDRTQNFKITENLKDYIANLSDVETGSYFTSRPNSEREVINGAMKVISGLDWLDEEIHRPKELIDFCLNNTPILEGCDVVDFVYVLYMCMNQSNYKKKEINILFSEILEELKKLYKPSEKGFSYFKDSSQTHYYGLKISDGYNFADIHGTTLCLWALIMILESLELKQSNWNIIKP